jgi:lysophospholipase L1-like esterase
MMFFPRKKDFLSKNRGLEVTVDGIHPNTKVAMALAQAIEQSIY